MPDDFRFTSVIHQTANALNPPPDYDGTADAMAHQLAREQHDFYTQQEQYEMHGPSEGHDFSWEGIKAAALGVGILLVLGLISKYIFHMGS
jgi:hypothetical protein